MAIHGVYCEGKKVATQQLSIGGAKRHLYLTKSRATNY